ncbi:MAG: hypothetical protein E4H05_02210 [Acidimicrobiales bacterium]|nr:MAG: hypothetical protein E4H05_02210 [Acidimicrobiales bacterium]
MVFVHAGFAQSSHERPRRRLVGFGRVEVAAGGRSAGVVDLDWSMLDLRLDGEWLTETGSYDIEVGLHANDPAAHHLSIERG